MYEQEVVDEELRRFAAHTRQPSGTSKSELAKKYLALCIGPQMYARVDPADYQPMLLRTHNPTADAYQEHAPEPKTFVYLMKHGGADKMQIKSVDELRDNHLGVAYAQPWEKHEDTQKWKHHAYFMALNFRHLPGYNELIEAIVADGLPPNDENLKRKVNAMKDRLQKVQLLNVDPEDLGGLLVNMKTPDHDKPVPPADFQFSIDDEVGGTSSKEEYVGASIWTPITNFLFEFASAPSSASITPPFDWKEFRLNEDVQKYRREAGLSATMAPQKLARQMVFAALGMRGDEFATIQPFCMVGEQQHLEPMSEDMRKRVWPLLLKTLPLGTMSELLDKKIPVVQDYHRFVAKGGMTGAQFLQSLLNLYVLGGERPNMSDEEKRVLKLHPKLDIQVIKSAIC
jgi:hypothetical protein